MSSNCLGSVGLRLGCRGLFAIVAYVLVTMFLADQSTLDGQVREAPLRELFIVETDRVAEKQLATVAEYAKQSRWDAGIALWRDVKSKSEGRLIRLNDRRAISLSHYCDIVLSRFSEAGLAAYRQAADPQAVQWFTDAETLQRTDLLHRVIETAFCSSVGDDALNALAEHSWEAGELELARHYWTMLVPLSHAQDGTDHVPRHAVLRYPDSDLDLAEVHAKLVLCSIMLGEFDRARQELEVFENAFGDRSGWLGGEESILSERLRELLAQAIARSDRSETRVPRSLEGMTATYSGTASRNHIFDYDPPVRAPHWGLGMTPSRFQLENGRPGMRALPPLSRFPVVWRDKVFVAGDVAVYGFEQSNGEPAWAPDSPPGSRLYPPLVEDPVRDEEDSLKQTLSWGTPRRTLTVDGNCLYARLGPPFTSWPDRIKLQQDETSLICLELDYEGRLRWQISDTVLESHDERWSFEGPPIAVGERLFTLVTRSQPSALLQLVVIEKETGQVLRRVDLGTPLNLSAQNRKGLSHKLLACAAGRLYVATDQGAIICYGLNSRTIDWIAYYPSQPVREVASSNINDRTIPAHCVVVNHSVFVAPNDSDSLFAFDAFTGILLWKQSIRGGSRQILGGRDTTLVVAGERLHGLDLASGRIRWSFGYEDPAGFGAGLGYLGERFACWPTRDDVFLVDWRTGRGVHRVPLKGMYSLVGGGNWAVCSEGVFLAGPESLIGFPFDNTANPQTP